MAFDATFEVGLSLEEIGLQPALPESRQPAPEGPLPVPMAALPELQLLAVFSVFSPSPKLHPRRLAFS